MSKQLRGTAHFAASLLIAAGVDIAIVSKRLGHSKIDLTADTYGHLIGKAGRQAAQAAADLVPRTVMPADDKWRGADDGTSP